MSRFSADISPDFISASSPSELRRLLFLNQKALGGEVKYISIQHDGKQWVAWFFNRIDEMAITEVIAKTKNKGSN
jgi:hypothetical protein